MKHHEKPTVLLLPGLDGTGRLLRDFRRALAPDIETALVTYPYDRGVTYGELEATARTALPDDRPYVLLGESFSGPIAIVIAASRPAGLRGLVLCCSFARNPRPGLAPFRPLVRLLSMRHMPFTALVWLTLGRFATPEARADLGRVLADLPPAVVRRRLGAVLGADVTPRLKRIAVPLLDLRACEDRLVPASAAACLATLPAMRRLDIEGPHFLLQARPTQAAAHVRAFLREIGLL